VGYLCSARHGAGQGAVMFAKIVVGLLIGFVGGFVGARGPSWRKNTEIISEVLLFIVGLSFLISSFMYGVVYGVMAIVEITAGFYAYGKAFRSEKAKS
jgi:NhaP-type Na+/H+ or K+/H+ antiporter